MGRIFDNIIKAAEKTRASPDIIDALTKAKAETQFTKAVQEIPAALLVKGHNPLTLLHSALSEGVHANTDEECLQYAQAIRLVLAELAERISQAVQDDKALNDAISKLMNKKKEAKA
jgi:hypothetical protein